MAERKRIETLPDEVEREHDLSRRKMLAAEAALLLLLRRRRAETFKLNLAPRETALRLVSVLTDEIFLGRRRARKLAVERMARELRAIGAHDVADALGPSGRASEALDVLRARRAAQAAAARWERVASAAGTTEGNVYRTAAARTDWVLRSAAGTETSTAFSAERRLAIYGLEGRVELWKVWDATLDHRTCSVCAHSHGTVVRLSEQFPGGRPGDVHNLCRCIETIVPVELTEPATRAA